MTTTLCAQAQPELPRAEDVIQKVLARAKSAAEQKRRQEYAYTEFVVVEELESDGSVKKREESLYEVFPLDGSRYRKLVQKDGAPLSEKELKAEQERERRYRQELAQKKRQREEEDDVLDEELTGRFHFETVGREPIQGRPAFVLTFEPKSRELPVRRRIDRFLNRLAGKVWIDEEQYEIARVEAGLVEKLSVWAGILVSVRKLEFTFESVRLEEGVWRASWFDQYIDARFLFSSQRRRQQQRFSEFRKVAPGDREPEKK